ncbi:MAG TPA: HIT family protein [Candidatus Paceibacterota bacterium]|nr:HIT family protein [Candidatus Paceibacterota bacterium]HOH11412.1 HIT family protein [Candidatus Paceibacterota bacterium]HOY11275.1 HIT family protein [Candidatus Paceibacterota bacterium]HPN89540.1 HIT family protein [Candidatus Paceibacterota bacterium]HPV33350.1 HIT family protein [Candidatus Paceibacterota bacterium]
MDCLFCKIVAGEIPAHKVYEDDKFIAFLDIKPVNPGHALIIPKAHYRNLFDMPSDLMSELGPLIKKIALAVKEATKAEGINIGWNNEPAAGQLIYHSHTHIMPRFVGDGFEHWHGKTEPTSEEFAKLATDIKKNLLES